MREAIAVTHRSKTSNWLCYTTTSAASLKCWVEGKEVSYYDQSYKKPYLFITIYSMIGRFTFDQWSYSEAPLG
jgi:hypothetical protein